jgi:hypothetical protein
MAKPQRAIPADMLAEPVARETAEKMARELNNEGVSDASIAVALLTSGIVHQYTDLRRGFESVIRYIAIPTIAKALFSYRRAAQPARRVWVVCQKPPFVRDPPPTLVAR